MNNKNLNTLNIFLEEDDLSNLNKFLVKNKFSKIFVLSDTNVLKHCYPVLIQKCPSLLIAEIIELEGSEENKNIETVTQTWEALIALGADKNSILINFGGGVISDLGGFVASTFKRGIPFINIPTSLMAMADASIGGKTGIDVGTIKNQVGTIIQPNGVFIYTPFLETLPQEHLKNGLAEIIKAGLIADKTLVKQLIEKKANFDQIILKSVIIKASIIIKDPHDKNVRKKLNFAHTIGHAVESTFLGTKKPLLHGEAVAIGIFVESIIAYNKKLITKSELNMVQSLIVPYFKMIKFNNKHFKLIQEFIEHDKKNSNKNVLMSLITGIGKCNFNIPVSSEEIEKAFTYYHSAIGK